MTTGKRRVEQTVTQLKADVAKLSPEKAALLAHEASEAWGAAQPELANLRRAALRQLLADHWTQADLAALLAVSRQRINQLIS